MMEALYPFFEWCEFSLVGQVIRQSLWLFPVIEAFHLVAFALLGGTILLVDLRQLGFLLRDQPVRDLWTSARHWRRGALVTMIVTGVLLFLSEAVKCYYSEPFRIKMVALFLGIVFSFGVSSRVARADPAKVGPFWGRLVAIASIVIWGTVAWAGRWIGFSG